MSDTIEQATVAKRGAEDSGKYFSYMAEYIGFTEADAAAVRESKPIIEKHLAGIVARFYEHLLRYPPTRKFFLKKDGSIDQEYLELRMRHLTNFWLRTASGIFDEDYARYVDYVGRAHTSRGADPHIYIAERYVIGQVGMVQNAISEVLSLEAQGANSDVALRAAEPWDKLMMVILEMLARAYGEEREPPTFDPLLPVDSQLVASLSDEAFATVQGKASPLPKKMVAVADAVAIPDGERTIVQIDGLSIGVFHHGGQWYGLANTCVHRGGPVATGALDGDILVCPWHGFKYDVTTGTCLADPSACLDTFPVTIKDGKVHLQVPDPVAHLTRDEPALSVAAPLRANEFRIAGIPAGQVRTVQVNGEEVAVFNIGGAFFATQNVCSHTGGPLNESDLAGKVVTCPIHGSQFDVTTGQVLLDPASDPLRTYRVTVDGEIGRVEATA